MKTRTHTPVNLRRPTLDVGTQRAASARGRGAWRSARGVLVAIAAVGIIACGGEDAPSNNLSNNTTPTNNTTHQTVVNNPTNNPECLPTAGGIEICDGIDNDCNGQIDEGFDGLGNACTVGEGACQASGVMVCANDKLGVVCDAQILDGCASPCLETCEGLTPVCDEASGNCVECVERNDCTGGVCLNNNTCVECANNADCASGACDIPNNTCVECLSNLNCPGGVCDVISKTCTPCLNSNDCVAPAATQCKVDDANLTQNTCVECLDNTPCTTPAAARCGTTNACGPCQDAADCAQVPNTNQCVQGTCVPCTTATEAADCNNFVCNPQTNMCTGATIGATLALNACVSDTQCLTNHACVPLNYMGAFHGNYCMPIYTGTACGRPYGMGIRERTSVGGVTQNVCMISEALTTPEAIADYGIDDCDPMNVADKCPAVGAECKPFDIATNICTYSCSTNNDCEQGSDCVGPSGNKYCGAL